MKYEEKLLPREYHSIKFGNLRVSGSMSSPVFSWESWDSCDPSLDQITNISIEQSKTKHTLTLTSESREVLIISYNFKIKRMEVSNPKPEQIPHAAIGKRLRSYLHDTTPKGKLKDEKAKDDHTKLS